MDDGWWKCHGRKGACPCLLESGKQSHEECGKADAAMTLTTSSLALWQSRQFSRLLGCSIGGQCLCTVTWNTPTSYQSYNARKRHSLRNLSSIHVISYTISGEDLIPMELYEPLGFVVPWRDLVNRIEDQRHSTYLSHDGLLLYAISD